MAEREQIGGENGNRLGESEVLLESKPGNPATGHGDLWETVNGFPLSLYRQLCYLC